MAFERNGAVVSRFSIPSSFPCQMNIKEESLKTWVTPDFEFWRAGELTECNIRLI